MDGDDSGSTDSALTIELCRETGEIRIRRTTALGTYTRTLER
jgi:hypothetical protein